MPISRDELKRRAERLIKAAERLDDGVPDSIPEGNATLEAGYGELERAFGEVAALLGKGTAEPPAGREFGAFLSDVGEAMLSTQRKLDEQSLAYIREARSKPHVHPSVFRVPKLSGELKFALSTKTGSGVNLIFLSRREEAEALHQQSMQFEMVALPAPPQTLGALERPLELVLEPRLRAPVLKAAAELGTKPEDRLPAGHDPQRVLLLRGVLEEEFYALYAGESGFEVGLWRVTLGAVPASRSVYRFDVKKGTEAESEWRTLVLEAGRRQAALLEGLD